jgi:hypothetical protein
MALSQLSRRTGQHRHWAWDTILQRATVVYGCLIVSQLRLFRMRTVLSVSHFRVQRAGTKTSVQKGQVSYPTGGSRRNPLKSFHHAGATSRRYGLPPRWFNYEGLEAPRTEFLEANSFVVVANSAAIRASLNLPFGEPPTEPPQLRILSQEALKGMRTTFRGALC